MDFKLKNNSGAMRLVTREEVPVLVYPRLEEIGFIDHCFTTRMGGASENIWSSMNLSFHRGDSEENVWENYRRMAKVMDTDLDHMICSRQTHTTHVELVGPSEAGKGLTQEAWQDGVDGLITDVPGLTLATFFADCVPLYFADPVHKAIGLSHSGWRGTVGRMGRATIEAMGENFGTRPEDLICAIGPSICQDCYEVGQEVAEAFQEEFPGRGEELLVDKRNGHYQLNLWRANQIILEEAGVKSENVITTDRCTCCNPELLFSHRASHGKRGNLAAFLKIKN